MTLTKTTTVSLPVSLEDYDAGVRVHKCARCGVVVMASLIPSEVPPVIAPIKCYFCSSEGHDMAVVTYDSQSSEFTW